MSRLKNIAEILIEKQESFRSLSHFPLCTYTRHQNHYTTKVNDIFFYIYYSLKKRGENYSGENRFPLLSWSRKKQTTAKKKKEHTTCQVTKKLPKFYMFLLYNPVLSCCGYFFCIINGGIKAISSDRRRQESVCPLPRFVGDFPFKPRLCHNFCLIFDHLHPNSFVCVTLLITNTQKTP